MSNGFVPTVFDMHVMIKIQHYFAIATP